MYTLRRCFFLLVLVWVCSVPRVDTQIYIISFVLLTTLTLLKLLIAVILDNFGEAVDMDMEKDVRLCASTSHNSSTDVACNLAFFGFPFQFRAPPAVDCAFVSLPA